MSGHSNSECAGGYLLLLGANHATASSPTVCAEQELREWPPEVDLQDLLTIRQPAGSRGSAVVVLQVRK